ncbi:MAG: hypothetical protein AAF677_05875, partial [Pseudomonadota bacterium]
MAIIRLNAARDGSVIVADRCTGGRAAAGRRRPTPPGGPGSPAERDWRTALDAALAPLPQGALVVLLVHGYRFTWTARRGRRPFCPQDKLYRLDPPTAPQGVWPRQAAWPASLGFSATASDALCLGFGWDARRPALATLIARRRLDFAEVHEAAAVAGRVLADVLDHIAARRPDLAPGFLAHSLGARVVLAAIAAAPGLHLGPAVLLGAAEHVGIAHAALAAQDAAGGSGDVLHVLSRANDPFDALFGLLAPPPGEPATDGPAPRWAGRTLGHAGLAPAGGHARWVDLQLDRASTAAYCARHGIALTRLTETVSHWHFFTDPGAMAAWRSVLRRASGWDLADLRAAGLDGDIAPRWSRLSERLARSALPRLGQPPRPIGAR